jgi:hypothetical protein
MELAGRSRRQQRSVTMCVATRLNTGALLIFSLFLTLPFSLRAAETLEQLTSAAKKESELYFVAGPTTFGGKKGLADLEAAFNRRFDFNLRLRFSAGPEMIAMAARIITELKAGGQVVDGYVFGFARPIRAPAKRERAGGS